LGPERLPYPSAAFHGRSVGTLQYGYMPKPTVLVVDDEPDLCELLSITLRRMDLDPRTAHRVAEAQRLLKTEHFDLCLTDMQLPDGDGLELVEWIQQYSRSVPVAVITAHGNMETAVRALKLGAFDFVSKPLDLAGLRKLVASAIKLSGTQDGDTSVFGPRLLGASVAMQHMREMIGRVARSQAPMHLRRIRDRKGAGGKAHPRVGPASRWSLRAGELRRNSNRAHGKRAIRSQARQLYRRGER
jgi:DNA-binding response OmpR family regulator